MTEAFWGDGLVWLRRAAGMVDGVAQADVSGLSHKDDFALARSLGDRRDARQASQGVIVSPSQSIRGFREQRGEHNPSDARQGSQDCHVALLIELFLGLLLAIGEPLGQAVDAVIGLADLAVDEIEPQMPSSSRSHRPSRPSLRSDTRRFETLDFLASFQGAFYLWVFGDAERHLF